MSIYLSELKEVLRRGPLGPTLRQWRARQMVRNPKFRDLAELAMLARHSQVVIDVGANVGITSLVLERSIRRQGGWVVALEPNPLAHAELSRMTRGTRIYPLNVAAADERTTLQLTVPVGANGDAISTQGSVVNSRGFDGPMFSVPATPIDDLIPALPGPVGLIKVDVEGFEMNVLRGARRLIAAHRPVLYVEVETRHNPDGQSAQAVLDEIAAGGYRLFAFHDDGPSEVPGEGFDFSRWQVLVGDEPGPAYVNNFVGVPAEDEFTLALLDRR